MNITLLTTSIGVIMKDPEMLILVLNDKAVLENGRMLKSVPDCYNYQQVCDKVVDNYPHVL